MKNKNIKIASLLTLVGTMLIACNPSSTSLSDGSEVISSSSDNLISNTALDRAMDMTALESRGDQKLLVVPVVFTNTTTRANESVHNMINKVFFGKSEDTGWESVSSYYEKSSFGKLRLGGEVTPYFYSSYSTTQFANAEVSAEQLVGPGNYWDQTHHLIEEIYNFLPSEKLLEYDLDKDGHVDALWMVYIAEINSVGGSEFIGTGGGRDPFWAYKFYWNREPNKAKPTPNVYAWASYKFATDGSASLGYSADKPDAHTFIHEQGHVFGLDDYYDYDGGTAPAGGLDMMDNNIQDHNMYSKFVLNWVTPYTVTDTANITLRPSWESGDFILLKDDWNGNPYDEYVIIEYFVPEGLNSKDQGPDGYKSELNPNGTKGYSTAGVRIHHIDSRIQKWTFDENDDIISKEWTDEIVSTETEMSLMVNSNTPSRSYVDPNFKLVHLLDGQGKKGKVGNWYKTPTSASDSSLFKEGTKIAADNWIQYFQGDSKFNDGTEVGYSVEIGTMTAEGVEIIITKA